MASPFSPRYAIAHLAKSKIWPAKNSRLRGFFSIRGRRLQRGGAFRRFVRVLTTRKWTETRRQIRPFRRRSGTGMAGGGRTALGRPHLRRYRDAFYHKQQLRAFHGKRTESRLRSLLRRYPSGTRLTTGAATRSFFSALEGRLDRILFRRRLTPTIYASHQFILHQGIAINGQLEYSPHALICPGDRISVLPKDCFPGDLSVSGRLSRWQSFFDSFFTRLYYRRWGLYTLRRRLATQLKKKLRPFSRSTRTQLTPLFLPPTAVIRRSRSASDFVALPPALRHYLKFWLSLRLRSSFLPRLSRSSTTETSLRYSRVTRRRARTRYLVARRSKRERRRKLPRLKPVHRFLPSYIQRERRTLRARRLRSPASEERRYPFRGPASHLFTFYRSRGRLLLFSGIFSFLTNLPHLFRFF